MSKKGDVLLTKLYPLIKNKLNNTQIKNKYKACLSRFVDNRSKELFATAPYNRIYFGTDDADDLYNSIGIRQEQIKPIISETYYAKIANFNPKAAKEPLTILLMMVIKFFFDDYKKHPKDAKIKKELENSIIYLSFSGNFYPSIHYGSFPKAEPSEYPHVMDYVVNNLLSNKFDLKREGSVIGAIKSIDDTWIDTYFDLLDNFNDDDIVYLIQQLHDRIKSFMVNIAKLYYDTYDNKDRVFTFDSDNLEEKNYRIADNDSLKIERAVESTINYINTHAIDYSLCRMAADNNVRTDEVKGIIEVVLNDNSNLTIIKELLSCIITDYYKTHKNPDLRNYEFISYSISPKPNSKEPVVVRQKEIIESWLIESSPAYMRRRSRNATKSSYFRSITTYFVLLINKAAK